MNKSLQILKILTQNKTVSGEVIAKELGVSRNMVWKIINSLIEQGFIITSSPKGYTFNSFPKKFTEEELFLKSGDFFDIKIFDQLPSTNLYCHENLQNFEKNTLIIARTQTKGKGRLNRSFISEEGGLYMSFCFKQNLPIEYSAHITLFTAVAVARAIEKICNLSVDIKWVNDLFVGGKKVCGILSEASISCEEKSIKNFIVGIGINANNKTLAKEIEDIATSLYLQTKKSVNMAILATEIINNMAKLPSEINSDFLNEYRKRCFIIGKTVYLENQPAQVLGVNNDCSLKVLVDNHEKNLYAGEVSLKLQ